MRKKSEGFHRFSEVLSTSAWYGEVKFGWEHLPGGLKEPGEKGTAGGDSREGAAKHGSLLFNPSC